MASIQARACDVRSLTFSMRIPPARNAQAMGTACATSVRTITGVTGASYITCRALKAALLLGLSSGSN